MAAASLDDDGDDSVLATAARLAQLGSDLREDLPSAGSALSLGPGVLGEDKPRADDDANSATSSSTHRTASGPLEIASAVVTASGADFASMDGDGLLVGKQLELSGSSTTSVSTAHAGRRSDAPKTRLRGKVGVYKSRLAANAQKPHTVAGKTRGGGRRRCLGRRARGANIPKIVEMESNPYADSTWKAPLALIHSSREEPWVGLPQQSGAALFQPSIHASMFSFDDSKCLLHSPLDFRSEIRTSYATLFSILCSL